MSDFLGRSIGRYHITEMIGKGGMATVYKGFDTRLERYVAIKFIRTDAINEVFLKRFEREAKALAKLSHPNIVKVHDFGHYEGLPYLVMEYVPGGTLKERLGSPMHWVEAARMLLPIARTLDYTHHQNIIHRDVKPANFLMTETNQLMLSDFGIAKIIEQDGSTHLTKTGSGIGTPEYMAPEQGMGGVVDLRADVYSLGVVFYELITGEKPFQADTPMAVLMKHITDPLPSPRKKVPNLPAQIERILDKALAKKPSDRYQSMADFSADLEMVTNIEPTVPSMQTLRRPRQPATPYSVQPQVRPSQVFPPQVRQSQVLAPQVIPDEQIPPRKSRTGLWVGGLALALITCFIIIVVVAVVSGNLWQSQNTAAITGTAQSLGMTIEYNQLEYTRIAGEMTGTAAERRVQETVSALSLEQTQTVQNEQATSIAETIIVETTQQVLDAILEDFSRKDQNWQTVYSESFSTSGEWYVGPYESTRWQGNKWVNNGVYEIEMTASKGFYHYAYAEESNFSNFIVSIDCGQESGSENGETGLAFMFFGEDKYYFVINSNTQTYQLMLFSSQEWTTLAEGFSDAIFPGELNHIAIQSENAVFTVFINNTFITQVENSAIRQGMIALVAGLSNAGEQATFKYDNFMIKTP